MKTIIIILCASMIALSGCASSPTNVTGLDPIQTTMESKYVKTDVIADGGSVRQHYQIKNDSKAILQLSRPSGSASMRSYWITDKGQFDLAVGANKNIVLNFLTEMRTNYTLEKRRSDSIKIVVALDDYINDIDRAIGMLIHGTDKYGPLFWSGRTMDDL